MSWYPICDWSACGGRAKYRDPGLGANSCGSERCNDLIAYSRQAYVFGDRRYWHLDLNAVRELQPNIVFKPCRITWPRLLQWRAAGSLRFLAEFSRQLLSLFARIVAGSWWKGPESLDYEVTLSGRESRP